MRQLKFFVISKLELLIIISTCERLKWEITGVNS